MKNFVSFCFIKNLILATAAFYGSPTFSMGSETPKEKTSASSPNYVPNQVLVSLKSPLKDAERNTLWANWNLKEVEKIGSESLYLLEVNSKEKADIKALVKEIEKNSKVKYAEPNMIQKTFSIGS